MCSLTIRQLNFISNLKRNAKQKCYVVYFVYFLVCTGFISAFVHVYVAAIHSNLVILLLWWTSYDFRSLVVLFLSLCSFFRLIAKSKYPIVKLSRKVVNDYLAKLNQKKCANDQPYPKGNAQKINNQRKMKFKDKKS